MISLNTIIKYYLLSIGVSLLYFIIFTKSDRCEDSTIDTVMSLPFVPFVIIRETYKLRFYFLDIIVEFGFKILRMFDFIVVRAFCLLVQVIDLLRFIIKSLDSLLEYVFLNFIQPTLSYILKNLGLVLDCLVFLIKYIIKVFVNILYKFTFIFDCIYILVKLIFERVSLAFNVCYFYAKTFFCMIYNCIYQVYLNLYPHIERAFNVIYIRLLNVYERLVKIFS